MECPKGLIAETISLLNEAASALGAEQQTHYRNARCPWRSPLLDELRGEAGRLAEALGNPPDTPTGNAVALRKFDAAAYQGLAELVRMGSTEVRGVDYIPRDPVCRVVVNLRSALDAYHAEVGGSPKRPTQRQAARPLASAEAEVDRIMAAWDDAEPNHGTFVLGTRT